MDPNILLDTTTPFDDNKINLLDQVINVLYTTKITSEREMANKILNDLKNLQESWQYCDAILAKSNNITTKIFALGILEDVIKQRWLLVPIDAKLGIRNFLIDLLIKYVQDDNTYSQNTHFINKLDFVIVLVK